MVASTSTLPLLFWSWINQSQNALVNYYVSVTQRQAMALEIHYEYQLSIEFLCVLRRNKYAILYYLLSSSAFVTKLLFAFPFLINATHLLT